MLFFDLTSYAGYVLLLMIYSYRSQKVVTDIFGPRECKATAICGLYRIWLVLACELQPGILGRGGGESVKFCILVNFRTLKHIPSRGGLDLFQTFSIGFAEILRVTLETRGCSNPLRRFYGYKPM